MKKKLEPGVNPPKGFYYDLQLNDPTTRMSLHPNTTVMKYFTDIKGQYTNSLMPDWATLDQSCPYNYPEIDKSKGELPLVDKDNHVIFKFTRESDKNTYKYTHVEYSDAGDVSKTEDNKETYPYSNEPIASAILNEDFKVSIANSFSKLGGDPVGQFINENKATLPLVSETVKFLKSIAADTKAEIEKNKQNGASEKNSLQVGWKSKLAGWIDSAAESPFLKPALLNRAVVFQGARFSFYGGTGISFDNMAVSYTIFPYWDEDGKFITVYDQLERLMPYVIGEFVPMNFGGVKHEPNESKIEAIYANAVNEFNNVISAFASWQLPPGGFEAYIKDVDVVQKGTLKLKLGSLYAVDNIVITSCNFSLSKHLIKDPSVMASRMEGGPSIDDLAKDYLTPAFCDVQLGLKPISMYSKQSLIRFIRGEENMTDRISVTEDLVNNLINLENENKELLGGEE